MSEAPSLLRLPRSYAPPKGKRREMARKNRTFFACGLMRHRPARRSAPAQPVRKAPTGIQGLDEITGGGLPRGRPTLVCGGPGCGKTILAAEFLVRGAVQFGEPG